MAEVQKDMQAKISESQMSSYQEAADKLFEAMDIITSKRVSSVGFDKTLVCTIESVENAKNGSYKVTDGTSHFNAYADTTTKYSEGQKVYVKIPGGDMNNQKIITGKYITSIDEFIPYVSALDSFVDVTDNVITASDSQFSLKANGNIPFKVIWEYNGERVTSSSSQAEKIKEIRDTFAYESEAVMADEEKSIEDKKKEIEALQKFAYDRINNLTSDVGYDTIIKEIQEAQGVADKDKLLMIEDLNGITSYSGFKGYKCLGLAGSFKTSALDLRTIKGAFGLRLDILGVTATGLTEFRRFYLDASEMFGNPYRYITFSKQEMMFDISMYAEIVQARLIFYQNSDFILEDGSKLDPEAFNADDIILQSPYVAFGFDMNSFTEDTIILGSKDSLMYSSENAPPYKDIYMRWVHDIDGKFYAIDEVEEVPEQAIIHWYRYKLEQNRSDILAGEFWAEIKDDPNLGKDLFNYTFTPDFTVDTDAFKVIIEIPSRKIITQELGMNATLLQKFGELKASNPSQGLVDGINSMIAETDMKKLSEDYTKYSGLYIQESDTTSKDLFEQIYNIIIGERSKTKFYESEQLVFTNAIPQAVESIDLIQGLSVIIDEENYEGIYRLYDDTYNIINSTEASKLRTMKAEYSSVATGIDVLDSAEEITWYFPVSNTMIQKPELGKEYSAEDIYIENCGKQGYVAIKRAGVDSVEKQEPGVKLIETTQKFRIKDRYVQAAHNNAIYCSIKKRGRIYEAYVLPTFGVAGSNGTDATFLLKMYENNNNEPGRQVSALTVGSSVIIVPELYDFNNQPIVITNSNKVSYKWSTGAFNGDDVIKCTPLADSKLLVSTESLSVEELQCYILKAEIPYSIVMNKEEVAEGEDIESRKVNLSAFLPIAVRSDAKYVELEGATWVVYENNGTNPKYYKIPYKLYGDNLVQYENIYWEGYSPDFKVEPEEPIEGRPEPPGIKTYYPVVTSVGEFKPAKMFYQGCDNFCVNAYDADDNMVWTQPVLISQNRYGSPMLNDWDGDLTIDEKNGTILSAMIGAGVKNKDNSFSGVLMGQIGKAFQTDNIGLYGYDHGAQSFSFDVTGTATLGVSGQGQIKFDGNKGTIQSGNYKENSAGMQIDLDDPFLKAYGPAGSFEMDLSDSDENLIHIDGFNIAGEKKSLLNIGANKYYLQSIDFSKENFTGVQFDLTKGKLTGYDFELFMSSHVINDLKTSINIKSTGNPYFLIHHAMDKTYENVPVFKVYEPGVYYYAVEKDGIQTMELDKSLTYTEGRVYYNNTSEDRVALNIVDGNMVYGKVGNIFYMLNEYDYTTGFQLVENYISGIQYYLNEDLNSKVTVYDDKTTYVFEPNKYYVVSDKNVFTLDENEYYSSSRTYYNANYEEIEILDNALYRNFDEEKAKGILYVSIGGSYVLDSSDLYTPNRIYYKDNEGAIQVAVVPNTYKIFEMNKYYKKNDDESYSLVSLYNPYLEYYELTEEGKYNLILMASPDSVYYEPNKFYYFGQLTWSKVQNTDTYDQSKTYGLLINGEYDQSYVITNSTNIYKPNTYYYISTQEIIYTLSSSYDSNATYYLDSFGSQRITVIVEDEQNKIFKTNTFYRYFNVQGAFVEATGDFSIYNTYYVLTSSDTIPADERTYKAVELVDGRYEFSENKFYIYDEINDIYVLSSQFLGVPYYEVAEGYQDNDLIKITKNKFELKSHDWDANLRKGMHFDISGAGGYIEGYSEYTNISGEIIRPKFILDWRKNRNPIDVNNGVFKVKWNGEVICTNLKATGGNIGSWEIRNGSLYSNGVFLYANTADAGIIVGNMPNNFMDNLTGNERIGDLTSILTSNSYFSVDKSGTLKVANAQIEKLAVTSISTKELYVDGKKYKERTSTQTLTMSFPVYEPVKERRSFLIDWKSYQVKEGDYIFIPNAKTTLTMQTNSKLTTVTRSASVVMKQVLARSS